MWSSFLVNLQACRLIAGNFTSIWAPSQIFFKSIPSPNPPNPPYVLIQVPQCSQHLWEALGYLPIEEMENFAEGNFYAVVGIWGGVILTIQLFFKAKNQHVVKISPARVKVKV